MNQAAAYLSLAAKLQQRILNGELPAGSKLPSERALCALFEVSRVSARDALHALESQGLIYRLNRMGWFVAPPVFIYDPTRSSSILEEAINQHRALTTELLSAGRETPPIQVSKALKQAPTQSAFVVTRRRAVDQRWVLLEVCYFRESAFPDLLSHDLAGSLTALVREQYGYRARELDVSISSSPISHSHAQHLQVREGCPSLKLERQVKVAGEPIALEREFWLHDAIEMRVKGQGS
ncbi:UTRA domain-containing protein [Hahella sp. HN01]|uniref:UTRA domain-containing protein n=1 Tax=Hahella sp. HN01 TaxID=2847262 RepID=UPI001C1EAF02|nr:UTRA domain-containing protein [Hahella sp. HN01]